MLCFVLYRWYVSRICYFFPSPPPRVLHFPGPKDSVRNQSPLDGKPLSIATAGCCHCQSFLCSYQEMCCSSKSPCSSHCYHHHFRWVPQRLVFIAQLQHSSLALFLPCALVLSMHVTACHRGRMKGASSGLVVNMCCSAPWVVKPTFISAGISKLVLVTLLLGNFSSMIYGVLFITGSLLGVACVNVPVNQTIPSLGKACWGAGMTTHWGCGRSGWACQLGIVTVGQQGAGLAFWAMKILSLIRMVTCFLALLASIPNSSVIISIVMFWPRAMVTLAFPVTLGMIALWPISELTTEKCCDVHIATKLCNKCMKPFTSWFQFLLYFVEDRKGMIKVRNRKGTGQSKQLLSVSGPEVSIQIFYHNSSIDSK